MKTINILLLIVLLSSAFGLAACASAGPALEEVTWVLESYGETGTLQTVLADTEITAEFKSADGKLGGSSGCNSYFGGYETSQDKLTVIPPIGATMMACPEPIMEQEQEYLSLLEAAETFRIQGGKLTISTSDGQILVFAGQ